MKAVSGSSVAAALDGLFEDLGVVDGGDARHRRATLPRCRHQARSEAEPAARMHRGQR